MLVIVTSVSTVFGELVPKYIAVARPLNTARAVVGLQLLLTPIIRLTNWAANCIVLSLGHRTGRGAAVDPLTAGTAITGADFGAQRRPGRSHGVAGETIFAVRHPECCGI